jgi:hypothetical protein
MSPTRIPREYGGIVEVSWRRRLAAVSIIIAAATALGGCAGGPAGVPGEKSALAGELLAIFPGLFVHGLGHRYAGNSDTADELLLMEGYSLLTAAAGGGLLAVGISEDAEAVEIGGWVGIGAGGLLYLGSWIYDIAFTPSEVKRYNQALRAGR